MSVLSLSGGDSCFNLMDIALSRNPFCCAKDDARVLSIKSKLAQRWHEFVAVTITLTIWMEFFTMTVKGGTFSLLITTSFDVVFGLDTVLKFYTSYYDSKRVEITDRRQIVCHTLMTTFVLDVFLLLPLSQLEFFIYQNTTTAFLGFFFRINKLMRFYKVIALFNFREATIGSNRVLIRSLKYSMVIFITFVAPPCVWYGISCEKFKGSTELVCKNNTWANNENFKVEVTSSTENIAAMEAVFAAVYWCMATMTTVGYGDVTAVTMEEKMYACAIMVIGICVYMAMALGGMASMVTSFDQQRATYLHKYNIIGNNMQDTDCDEDLKKQAIGFYKYLWIRRKGEDVSDVYKGLPSNFVSEISFASHKNLFKKAHLFDDLGSGFLRMVSLLIRPVLFLPQQIVVAKGDVVHQMFYILNGELEVLSEDDHTPILTLKSGKLFGELSLMYSLPRTATIRAVTHCDLMCLERRDLHNLLKQYPDISKKLHDRAKERCDKAVRAPDLRKAQTEAYNRRKTSYIEPSSVGSLRKSFAALETASSMFSHHSFHSKVHPKKLEVPGMLPSTASHLSTHSRMAVSKLVTPSLYHRQHQSVCSLTSSVDVIDEEEEEEEKALQQQGGVIQRLREMLEILRTTTICPESSLLFFWQKLVLIIAVILAIVYPYMACFHGYNEVTDLTHNTRWKIFFAVTYICDLILLLDVFVNLRTGIVSPHGTLTEFKDIVEHYCKSRNFVFDILCVIPLEAMVPLIEDKSIHMPLFGFLKLNRVIKVLDLPKEFSHREARLEGEVFLSRTIKLCLYVLISSHWAACFLFLWACPIAECNKGSWVDVYMEDRSLTDLSGVTEYILALYFATATMTSTGYGDITAQDSWSRHLAGWVMKLGLFLYGYCVSVQAATLANLDAPRVRYYEKYFAIKDYMESHHIPSDLQKRITNYLKIQWTKYGGIWSPGEKSMLHEIPVTLREDILLENHYWIFNQCPVFAELDMSFIRLLSTKLISYTFCPGDAIVYAGDFGKEMYMIRRGVCQYLTPNKEVLLAEMTRGQYFGDLSMLYKDCQMGTVRAKTHVEVLELRLDDFEEALKEFPLIQAQFKTLMEDKSKWKQIKAKLKKEIEKAEADTSSVDNSLTALSGMSGLRNRKRRKSSQPSTKVFSKLTGGDPDEEYQRPFEDLDHFYRLLARLLMRRTFLPGGRVVTWWIRFQLLIACIQSLIVPFQAAFMYSDPFFQTIQYTIDFISLISLYLGLHMAYYDNEGVLVSHPVYTASQYLTSNFAIDLLGCFPFELILLTVYHDGSPEILHFVSLIRLIRLLQLYRLPLAFTASESRIDKDVEGIKTLKFVLYVIVFNNILTCCLYLMACPPTLLVDTIGNIEVYNNARGDQCINGSWIYHAEQRVSVSLMYTVTLYWAVATSVSVGYGDITAHSNLEMIVALIVMIAGVMFYGYIIASIAASLANADTQRAEYHEKMEHIKRYMDEHDVWHPLQKKVMGYYDYIWQRTRGVDPKTLFEGLPIALWEDITCSLYQETLSKMSWFKDTEKSFLKTLSRHVKAVIYRKGDYICRKADIGTEVFFIKRGMVDVVSEDGSLVFETLTTGQSFGEDAWLFKSTRSASIRARTNCDLFILTKEDLDFVLEPYPYLKGRIAKIAKAEMSKAQIINESMKIMDQHSTAGDRKEMSHAFRRVRLEDLKRVDPESGLSDAGFDEQPAPTFKAKPRMSLVRGSLAGTDPFELPAGLKDLQKRMSTFPDAVDVDSLTTESSGMIVPAVTCRKKASSETVESQASTASTTSSGSITLSRNTLSGGTKSNISTEFQMTEMSGHDSSVRATSPSQSDSTEKTESDSSGRNYSQNNSLQTVKQNAEEQNCNCNNLDSMSSSHSGYGEKANDINLASDSSFIKESNFSLSAPSHGSILCTGIHLPEETVEVKSGVCCRRLQNFIIHPFSWFYWIFSVFMCFFGVLSGWLIMYQAAFQDHNSIVLSLNYFIDVFYVVQIFINFHLSFYDENGDLIESLPEMRRHYLHSRYYFAVDIISAAPLELAALTAPSGTKMIVLSVCRLLRLSRLIRVYQFYKELEHQLNVNILFVRMSKFVAFVTLAVHLFACLWYLVACPFGECKEKSWIGKNRFENNLEAYITSVYWCLATVTSTGYGDVSPHTEVEVWVAIVTMVFGKFMFGIVLANIASTLTNAETERVSYDDKHQALMSHMSDQKVPKPLKHRVSEYCNYMWQRNRGRGVRDLFSDAPSALRAEILLNVTRDMLESIPFFEHTEDNFLRQIAPRVDKEVFLPGDFIAIKGDMGHKMYYIYRGEVEVVNEDNPSDEPTILSKGDIVGEVSLVYCVPRRVTLKTVNYVDLFSLSKIDLDEVLENFPDIRSDIQMQAQQRFRYIVDAMKRAK